MLLSCPFHLLLAVMTQSDGIRIEWRGPGKPTKGTRKCAIFFEETTVEGQAYNETDDLQGLSDTNTVHEKYRFTLEGTLEHAINAD